MKAKLLILVSCFSFLLVGCVGYDNAFCRSDFCTDTSYIPNATSNNASYSCGTRGSGFASCGYSDTSYTGGGCGCGSRCAPSIYSCKESVWDNPYGLNEGD
jgi:hypothetical protein